MWFPINPKNPHPLRSQTRLLSVNFSKTLRLKIVSVGTKIYVDKEADFKTICDELRKANIEFFTHPFGEAKTFKLILAGLPEFPTEDISEWLKTQNNITTSKITILNTIGSYKKYLIQFNPNENSKSDVMNVKVVLNHVIKWVPAKNNRRGPTQCLRCAMFGHGISTCNRKPICILCGDAHESKDCKFGNDDENDQRIFKCHNCKVRNLQHNHKANDPLCPSRCMYIEIRASANGKKQIPTQPRQQLYAHAAQNFPPLKPAQIPPPLMQSFANATKNTNQRAPKVNVQQDSELFTYAEVSSILFNCINELEKCSNKFDKLRVIANMLGNVCK